MAVANIEEVRSVCRKVRDVSSMFGVRCNEKILEEMQYEFPDVKEALKLNKSSRHIEYKNAIYAIEHPEFSPAITSMNHLFEYCESEVSIDMSLYDTSNVTDMSGMFVNCDANILNMDSMDTHNVTSMNYMFRFLQARYRREQI